MMNSSDSTDSATNNADVIIVGAGIGGLCCALALIRQGVRVLVLEQAPVITEVGAALQISPNATAVLEALGVGEALAETGFRPQGILSHHWRSGRPVARVRFDELDLHSPYYHIHRADLQKLLLEAVSAAQPGCVRTGQRMMALESDEQGARLILANGEWLKADWVIGADGIHSHARDYVAGIAAPPSFTGNVAWRGLLAVEDIPEKLRPPPYANIWMGPGAHVVMYYIRGGELLNFVAVTETDSWKEESWTSRGSLKEMLHDYADWTPELFDVLALTDPASCYRWALFDRTCLDQWWRNRVILVGDAVHPMLPFVAQGAAMAIEDAWALAQCLSNEPSERAGEAYTLLRRERVARIQQAARDNMRLFHYRSPLMRGLRDTLATTMAGVNPKLAARRVQWIYDHAPQGK